MGPLGLGFDDLALGGNPAATGGATDTGFLLWVSGANYLTIDASGDKIFINQQ